MRLLSLVLLAAALASGCRTLPQPSERVVGTWALRAFVEGTDSLSTADGLPNDLLRFEPDGGIRTRSCNVCSGNYVVSDRHVVARNLACTRRACEVGRLELDRYVAGRAAYRRSGDLLVLDIDDQINGIDARLYFAPAAAGVWDVE
jgi:heat shock protein HslJ